MSPLDVKGSPPVLKGEDGEGSTQVKMDQSIKIDVQAPSDMLTQGFKLITKIVF